MPSGPGFQPALSSIEAAFSTLNSNVVLGDRNGAGLMTTFGDATPPRP